MRLQSDRAGGRAGLLLTCLLLVAPPAPAQRYSDFTVGAGFRPDPQIGTGRTGGDGHASRFGPGCVGRISDTPDHRIQVTSALGLRLSVSSDTDSTLALVGPAGVFCDDDSGGRLDARIDARLTPGQYAVYVGHMERAGDYRLSLSELPGRASPDFVLGAGFLPDPRTATGITGGGVDASRHGAHCAGMIAAAPDHRLTITSTVVLDIAVESATDSSLVILGPGKALCDDDGGQGLDARIVEAFRPGEYAIHVGHIGEPAAYTLTIREGDRGR